MTIEQIVAERSKHCEVFGNPLRTFIALFVVAKGEASWSELKSVLEKRSGSINPNTLSFHIGKLIETGFLKKIGSESQPKYRIIEDRMPDIEEMVGKDSHKENEGGTGIMSWSQGGQISQVKMALESAIAASLDEITWITKIQILEFSTQGGTHSVSGTFTVTPWLYNSPRRKGRFDCKMDKVFNIISLKIQEAAL